MTQPGWSGNEGMAELKPYARESVLVWIRYGGYR
jgi:hypothetical protein